MFEISENSDASGVVNMTVSGITFAVKSAVEYKENGRESIEGVGDV